MKKITLALTLALSMSALAQDNAYHYTFSKSTAPYVDLEAPTSINNNVVWEYENFGNFPIPFSVEIFGNNFSLFSFSDDYFIFQNGNSYSIIDPLYTSIMDRGVDNNTSISPISYKIEGENGNRILKLEIKNAGIEDEYYDENTNNQHISYQVWFYENDKSIEFRYGSNNISPFSELIPVIALLSTAEEAFIGALNGDATNPIYIEFVENENTDYSPEGFSNAIPANTVYRFEKNNLAVESHTKTKFSISPNPANDVLNIASENLTNEKYAIFDVSGRVVLKGNLEDKNINISNLTTGQYFLKIGNTATKFIKK